MTGVTPQTKKVSLRPERRCHARNSQTVTQTDRQTLTHHVMEPDHEVIVTDEKMRRHASEEKYYMSYLELKDHLGPGPA